MSSRLRWSEERKAVIFTPLKLQYTPCQEYFVKRLVFGLILLLVTVTVSAQDTILIKLEEPTDGGLSSGVGNIRGWAIASVGVRRVELFIDGQYSAELPYGGERADIEIAHPNVSGSINSGFGQIFNYGLLGAGEHIFTVRAHMNDGQISEDTATFTVVALPKAFYPDDERPNFSNSSVAIDQQSGKLSVYDVYLSSGEKMNFELMWSTPAQNFAMIGAWEGCTGTLTDQLDVDLVTVTARSISVVQVDGVVPESSEFELNLLNETGEDLTLLSVRISDSEGDLARMDTSSLEASGKIPNDSLYTINYKVGSEGAEGVLSAEFVLGFQGQCFTRTLEFFNTSPDS